MKRTSNKILVCIVVCAAYLSLIAPVLADNGGESFADGLSGVDSFHPPASGDPRALLYDEWHYFNIIDEKQHISFITTLTLKGNVSDPDPTKSAAIVLMNYLTPVGENLTLDKYPVTLAQWSDKTPDMQVAKSTVTLTEQGYYVHTESKDAQTVFDAIFKPETEHSPVYSASFEPYRIISWLVASPEMRVDGTLTVNKGTTSEKTYLLQDARGYHDHNWGYWLWQDDIGWDWGQASERGNYLEENEKGTYTFAFGNITNKNHSESKMAVLNIWKNQRITASFESDEIKIQRYVMRNIPQFQDNPFPMVTSLNADSGKNKIRIVFTAEKITPIPIPLESGNGYRIIWELVGSYVISGYIDGEPILYITKGYLEYVA